MKLSVESKKSTAKRVVCGTFASVMVAGSLSGCGVTDRLSSVGDKPQIIDETDESGSTSGSFSESSKSVKNKTEEIEGIIDKYFYFDQDDDKREESYYDGIMKGLDDPYSVYYTQEEYEKLMEEDSGEFEGIGATVSKDNEKGTIYIVKPIVGSPAEKAGLLPDDVIVAVDDLDVTSDMELDYVVDHIRGEKGSKVTLKIYREGEPDFLFIDIVRDTITNTTVSYEMLDNSIGYIQVEQFVENTPELYENAIDDLMSQGAKGLVIDLRNNPGGLLKAVIEMADYVIDDSKVADGASQAGLLLQTKDKDDNILEEYSCDDKHSIDLPMAVLVNGNSASASEIFSGCLKDYGVAKIVGTTTYGKGIVQSVMKLKDGSAVKLTIAQYFLPSGTAVHKVGVEPDVEVELNDDQKRKITIEHDKDNQLQEAIKQLGN